MWRSHGEDDCWATLQRWNKVPQYLDPNSGDWEEEEEEAKLLENNWVAKWEAKRAINREEYFQANPEARRQAEREESERVQMRHAAAQEVAMLELAAE